jgi:hypothetical protein
MSPDQISTILRSLERMDGKLDEQGTAINEAKREITEVKLIAQEARDEGKKTNGRVSRIEDREAEARGAAREVERQHEADDRSGEKWRNIAPAVIASVVSGLTVGGVMLIVAILVTGQP